MPLLLESGRGVGAGVTKGGASVGSSQNAHVFWQALFMKSTKIDPSAQNSRRSVQQLWVPLIARFGQSSSLSVQSGACRAEPTEPVSMPAAAGTAVGDRAVGAARVGAAPVGAAVRSLLSQ